jgi:hypothetical protein
MKYVSLIVCVSAAGETLIPYMVTSQDSMGLREASKKCRMRFWTDLFLKARETAYVNTDNFLEYIRMVFMLNLNVLRSLEQFAGEDAVLLMITARATSAKRFLLSCLTPGSES